MFTPHPALPDSRIRRFRGLVAFIALTVVFLLVPPSPPAASGPGTWFVVDTDTEHIFGEGWSVATTVSIAIDLSYTASRPDLVYTDVPVAANGTFDRYVGGEYTPMAGDVITVADGHGITTTYQVQPFEVMGSDEQADTVSGTGMPGALVKAMVIGMWNTEQLETVGPDGRWSFDYTGIADLKAGTSLLFREYDDFDNATQTTVVLPIPEDFDGDMIPNMDDNCPRGFNPTQYDGDGDGRGVWCDDVDRMWGANRYGTAAAVSNATFDQVDTVFIALGTNFPDALVAAAAGGYLDVPVLLTRADTLPPETIAELMRLKPHNAYIVGGTAVIRPSVEQQLGAYVPNVMRLAGKDRYATAADVATKVFHSATEAFVALGTNFPDALVAASPAGVLSAPVLLTARDHVPQSTLDVLAAMHPTKIYIVGGTAAISATVAQELAVYGPVERLAGENRYETATAVSRRFSNYFEGAVLLAYGGNFPDALVAGAVGSDIHGFVLLVDRTSIPAATRTELDRLQPDLDVLVGGTAVISEDVFNALP